MTKPINLDEAERIGRAAMPSRSKIIFPGSSADGCAEEQRKLFGCAPDAADAKRWRWWCNLVLTEGQAIMSTGPSDPQLRELFEVAKTKEDLDRTIDRAMNDCGTKDLKTADEAMVDRESLAKEIETGRFCPRVEHITGSCDCEEIAAFIRTFGTT